jgi:2-polyprenyl-3-methyl-5-hydroxy-6-metoxy-1,4-benzoquinol methylase
VQQNAARASLSSAAYDEQWSRLSDFVKHNPGSRHRRRLIRSAIGRLKKPIESVLDVGCGLGETIIHLNRVLPAARVNGVDISPVAIEACRQSFPDADFHVLDIVEASLPTNFDLVVCSEVVEHLDDPTRAISNMRKMTQQGGFLVLTTQHGRVHATEEAIGHTSHPTRAELLRWIQSAGYSVLEMRQWGWPGYLMLKYLVNLAPGTALREFGTDGYGALKIRMNRTAYFATGSLSLPSTPWGPQFVVTAQAT